MAKKPVNIIIYALIFVCFLILVYVFQPVRCTIDDIWVVNMDKDKARMNKYMEMARYLPRPVNRWPGTNGREETRTKAAQEGVSTFITKSMKNEENLKSDMIFFKPGVVGCWLSHKRLLRHLSTLNVPDQFGHLITEDDIIVPTDFTSRWEKIRGYIPYDWDIVYFYVGGVHGHRLNPYVLKWRNDKYAANWGTVAYMVRHGAVPHILKQLKYMDSPIDVQYYRRLENLKIYILDPQLITTGDFPTTL